MTFLIVWAQETKAEAMLMKAIAVAPMEPPIDYVPPARLGPDGIPQRTVAKLVHAPNLEESVVDTVMRGDSDTYAANRECPVAD